MLDPIQKDTDLKLKPKLVIDRKSKHPNPMSPIKGNTDQIGVGNVVMLKTTFDRKNLGLRADEMDDSDPYNETH